MKKNISGWWVLIFFICLSLLSGQGPLIRIIMFDTNQTHYAEHIFNEDDTSNRVINWSLNSANRAIDLSADLTLTTAGAALIDDANAAAQRTTMGVAIGSDVQAYDADLTTYAGITPSANVQTLLGAANFAAFRASLGLDTADDPQFDDLTVDKLIVNEMVYFDAETTATPSGAFTIDWGVAQKQRITITGVNLDMSFTDPSGPCNVVLVIVQGDGDDTIDWTHDTKIGSSGSVAPTLSTGNGDIDVVGLYFDGTNYWITYTKNFGLIT